MWSDNWCRRATTIFAICFASTLIDTTAFLLSPAVQPRNIANHRQQRMPALFPPRRVFRAPQSTGGRGIRMVATQDQSTAVVSAESPPASTAVIGSGPAGLATAIMLARRGWSNIYLYDRLERLPKSDDQGFWESNERAYNIGLDLRGQNALKRFGCWDRVERCTADVTGRIDWVPGAEEPRETNTSQTRGYVTKIIQRDRLAGCLLEEIEAKYSDKIHVQFDTECRGVQWNDAGEEEGRVRLRLKRRSKESGAEGTKSEIEVDFVVGADGVNSKVRRAMVEDPERERGLKVKRFEDNNVRLYKTITLRPAPGQNYNVNLSARTSSDINLDALPTREGTLIGVVLFRPHDDRVLKATTAAKVRALFREHFPMLDGMLDDAACDAFANKPPSSLPIFQYCGPVVHKGASTVLLGDAIHAVKPFFGLGVNSAFEDIAELDRSLDSQTRGRALSQFSERRGKEAKAIVEVSRAFDRPGTLGFVSFVLPIILDSVFGRLFPKLFKPNFLAYTKDPSVTFVQARARKFRDRVVQSAILASVLVGVPWLLAKCFRVLQMAILGVA